ncbi:MAG: IS5 family transposase [Pseudobdellovibrionaceae bacterium]
MKTLSHKLAQYECTIFQSRIDALIDKNHPIVQIADKINWKRFDENFSWTYSEEKGRPSYTIRLMVGLLILKYTYSLSDDDLLERFSENIFWQYLCGNPFFEYKKPCDSTTIVKWRKKIGDAGMEEILSETLTLAKDFGFLKVSELKDVNLDTTVQEKNICHPTDSKLINKARENLVKAARKCGIRIKQSYNRKAKFIQIKSGRYFHAKQFKRGKNAIKKLRTMLGRVIRDVRRKMKDENYILIEKLDLAEKIFNQLESSRNKIYSLHEPYVDCISKGKARKRYEFGCKVSIMTTNKSNWVVGSKAIHGNPFDGHTVDTALNQAEKIIGKCPSNLFMDKGYRGADIGNHTVKVNIAGSKRAKDKSTLKKLKRRSAIEPIIGHMKFSNRMDRNYLKGISGDKINAVLAGCGRNMRKIIYCIKNQ